MSHYSVAVFTDEYTDVESLLEPFYEGLEVEKYICMTKKDLIERGKEEIAFFNRRYKEYMKNKREYRRKHFKNINHLRFIKKVPYMKKWNTEKIYKFATRYCDEDEISEDGGLYSTYNPDSKWDWYEIGGRWKNELILKRDNDKETIRRVNSALIKDIDWNEIKKRISKHLIPYKKMLEETIFDKEYLIKLYPDEETYKEKAIQFCTYAVLTPDGEWKEPGKMGWWGISSASDEERINFQNNYFDNFLKNINPEWRLTIVDCHI